MCLPFAQVCYRWRLNNEKTSYRFAVGQRDPSPPLTFRTHALRCLVSHQSGSDMFESVNDLSLRLTKLSSLPVHIKLGKIITQMVNISQDDTEKRE